MAAASRRPPARRRPARRTARRRNDGGTWIVILLAIGLIGALLQFLAAHPVLIVLAVLAAAGAAAWAVARKAQAREQRASLAAARANISSYLVMTPLQFEHAIAYLCQRDGCTNVKVVGGAGDLGADVIATTPSGHRIVIQAKRYAPTNRVGSPELQKVGGTARQVHGAHVVAAVTTSGFTKAAREYAALPAVGIRLVDHDGLARWATRAGPAPWH